MQDPWRWQCLDVRECGAYTPKTTLEPFQSLIAVVVVSRYPHLDPSRTQLRRRSAAGNIVFRQMPGLACLQVGAACEHSSNDFRAVLF